MSCVAHCGNKGGSRHAVRLYLDRTLGCDCDHRGFDRALAACGPGSREAARRGQCTNNLKQIILATHNYQQAVNALPNGHYGTGWNDWSCLVMLLPYMEQGNLYNTINFANTGDAADPGDALNNTAMLAKVNVLLCPSDIDRLSNLYGHQNYCGNAGSATEAFFDNNIHGACNGCFFSVNNCAGSTSATSPTA